MEQQCLGITRSGERCKISGNLTDGYCHLHRKKVAPDEPTPPVGEPPLGPAAASDKRNTPLIVAAFLLLFLLLAGGIRTIFSRRRLR